MGPIARFVDFAGLSEYIGWPEASTSITRKSYHMHLQNNLVTLKDKYQQIEKQREQLVSEREAVLQNLREINTQLQSEAEKYVTVIERERNDFMEQFPEIERLGKALVANFQEGIDPQQQLNNYQDF